MSPSAERPMSVDEFLDWASAREGKFELHDGRPVAMSPERVRHAGTKGEAYGALRLDPPGIEIEVGDLFEPEP